MTTDADPLHGPFRWRHLVVGVPLLVWLVTACFGSLLAAWTVLQPFYQSPDEPNHVDRVLAAAAGNVMPAPKSRHTGAGIVASEHVAGITYCCPAQPTTYLLDHAPPHDQRPSIAHLGGLRSDPKAPLDQLTQHPPLYYLWEAATAKAIPSTWPYDFTLEALRFASALLVLPLPLLAFAATRRLTGGAGPVAVGAAMLPLGIPGLTALGASVNNDAGMVLTGGLLTVLLAYVTTGDTSRRTGAWVGVVVAAGLLVKAFAFAAVPAVALAYLVAWRRTRRARPVRGALTLAAGLTALLAGWYWVRNLVLYGHLQPNGGAQLIAPAPPGFHPHPLAYLFHGYPSRMMTTFFGSFGWLADPLPAALIAVLTAVLLGGIVLACRARRRPEHPWSWADVVVLVLPAATLFATVAAAAYHGYAVRASTGANQGRYLYYGLAGLVVVVALAGARLPAAARRWLPLGLLVAVASVQAVAVHSVLTFFWGLPGTDLAYHVHDAIAWSAWDGKEIAALGALSGVIGVAAAVVAAGHYGVRGRYRPRRAVTRPGGRGARRGSPPTASARRTWAAGATPPGRR